MAETKSMKIPHSSISVVDDTDVPTTFIDAIHGLSVHQGVVTVNLTRLTVPIGSFATKEGGDADGRAPYFKVVQRLVIPIEGFVRISALLSGQVDQFLADGLIENAPDNNELVADDAQAEGADESGSAK